MDNGLAFKEQLLKQFALITDHEIWWKKRLLKQLVSYVSVCFNFSNVSKVFRGRNSITEFQRNVGFKRKIPVTTQLTLPSLLQTSQEFGSSHISPF